MTHIMLDLETWGKKPGCDIRSIGACVFDPVAGTVGISLTDQTAFYIATNNPLPDWYHGKSPDTNRKYMLSRDPETVQWWNDQGEEAQAAFANPIDLREACLRFTDWLCEIAHGLPNGLASVRIWVNGPHFDIAILQAVFDAVGLDEPWHYRAPRDFRTITEAAGMTRDDYCSYGAAHNALDDAIAQTMTVCEAYKRLGLQR